MGETKDFHYREVKATRRIHTADHVRNGLDVMLATEHQGLVSGDAGMSTSRRGQGKQEGFEAWIVVEGRLDRRDRRRRERIGKHELGIYSFVYSGVGANQREQVPKR